MKAQGHITVRRRAKDGKPGADGVQGMILRHTKWIEGYEYHNDENLTSGVRYLDVAVLDGAPDAIDGTMRVKAYQCVRTHTSTQANKPGSSGGSVYWQKLNQMQPIFTPLIIAQNADIKFMQGNRLLIMKSDGTTIAGGMQGAQRPFWLGAPTADTAPVWIDEDGAGQMAGGNFRWWKDSDGMWRMRFEGQVAAKEGYIGGFLIHERFLGTSGITASSSGHPIGNGGVLFDEFIRFQDDKCCSTVGINLDKSTGSPCLGSFVLDDTKTEKNTISNIGLKVSVTGCPERYRDAGKNIAIDVLNGHIFIDNGYVMGAFVGKMFDYRGKSNLTVSKDMGVVLIDSDITLGHVLGLPNGFILKIVNTSEHHRALKGEAQHGKYVFNIHRLSTNEITYYDGKFYPSFGG